MFVSLLASPPHLGHLTLTQESIPAKGDSPVPVGSYFLLQEVLRANLFLQPAHIFHNLLLELALPVSLS